MRIKGEFSSANVRYLECMLAIKEIFQDIVIEGDAKLYFDALNRDVQNCYWNVKTLLSNAVELKTYFANCFFFIESRESIML